MKKRIFALLLAACMLCGCTAGAETIKHERVFAVENTNGEVLTLIDSVRLENKDGLDEIADRTMLQSLENVGGHQRFTLNGETLTWAADGESITYQGTADKAPDVSPVVTVTLDGQEVTLNDLRSKSGHMVLTVRYALAAEVPYLAATILPLDEHISDISVDNGMVISEGKNSFVLGIAIPGADESLELPDELTITAQADHADLTWMMTFATAQPLEALCGQVAEYVDELRDMVTEVTDGLIALRDGAELSDGEGELHESMVSLRQLFSGVAALNDGASALADGANSLNDGAATLEEGLTTLTDNNATLNQGAAQLFAAILDTANNQLASAGLEAAGISLPMLTADNYAQALQTALDQLNPEVLTSMATEAAREQVRAEVLKQEDAVRAGVSQAVEAQVLEGILASSGIALSSEDYESAVRAGKLDDAQVKQISAAVKQMMASDEVKAKQEAAVAEQIDKLVDENLASEAVQAQITEAIAPAKAGWEALSGLKAQLDAVNAFVTGLEDYTSGVAQASTGAIALHAGAAQLNDGAAQLTDGATALAEGLDRLKTTLTGKFLDFITDDIQEAIRIFDQTNAQLNGSLSYDLISEDMAHDLVFFIRTDLTK